jgi:sugar O-acyltransferase (sialic acid O-acetyltransferase NeuD family)
MKQKLVIFGNGKIADVVISCMLDHPKYEVVGQTVDRKYLSDRTGFGWPCVAFDEVEKHFPPEHYEMFVAIGYQQLNALRASKFEAAEAKGYKLPSIVSVDAPKDLECGSNCFVMSPCCIHPRVKLGNNVFVWGSAIVGHHATIGSNTWITSGANIGGCVTVQENCFFALNSTVSHQVSIGKNCFVGANTLITKSAENGQVFFAERSTPGRLNSDQFLRMSGFNDL